MTEHTQSRTQRIVTLVSNLTDRIIDLGSVAIALLVPILWITGKVPMTGPVIMLYISTLAVIFMSVAMYKAKRAGRR